MKIDIQQPDVKYIAVAIIKETNNLGESEWSAHLINFKEEQLTNVIIVADGKGEIDGEIRKTSTMRYFFPSISSLATVKIEPILDLLFDFENRYWVSFYIGNQIFDKKFIFKPGSVKDWLLEPIPFFPDAKGVLLQA